MNVINSYPPNIDSILNRFSFGKEFVKQRGVVFSYGDDLYNPSGVNVSDDLLLHEATHGSRQKTMGVEEWWNKYLEEDEFRLNEEIIAYKKQYAYLHQRYKDREVRASYLMRLASDLSSDIYDNVIEYNEAVKIIRNGLH